MVSVGKGNENEIFMKEKNLWEGGGGKTRNKN